MIQWYQSIRAETHRTAHDVGSVPLNPLEGHSTTFATNFVPVRLTAAAHDYAD